jgi:hypothetical protein
VEVCEPRQGREAAALSIPSRRRGLSPGRIAQRESARFTRGRSLVRSQVRPWLYKWSCAALCVAEGPGWKRLLKRLAADHSGRCRLNGASSQTAGCPLPRLQTPTATRRTMVGRLLPLLPSLVRREATGRYRREGSSASEAARDRGAPRTGVPCCSVAGEAEAHKEPVARALHRTASGVLGQAPSYAWRWQASMSFLSAFRTPESLSTNSALKAKTSRRPSTAFWHI